VTLNSDTAITAALPIISFSQRKNITYPSGNIPLILFHDYKMATASVTLTVANNLKKGDTINFTVHTNVPGFEDGNFNCNARTIDPNTLILTIDNQY
ncbi:hypothetical protein KKJ06_23000, partial [Xenorhabdus bovienii]|uniref:hypothetical protein n=1 Tax=Xenorhabdus bovienii TaxID=40576 RepID=UPI0023B20882